MGAGKAPNTCGSPIRGRGASQIRRENGTCVRSGLFLALFTKYKSNILRPAEEKMDDLGFDPGVGLANRSQNTLTQNPKEQMDKMVDTRS